MSDERPPDLLPSSPPPPEAAPQDPSIREGGARNENREHQRIPIQLRVDYRRTNGFLSDYTRNISRGGTFIVTDRPLAVGTLFRFTLTVPTPSQAFELIGEVIWARSGGDEPGMGIRFVYRSDDERRKAEEAMQRLLVESLGPTLAEKLLSMSPAKRG